MADRSYVQIGCPIHEKGTATYICGHLKRKPEQRWITAAYPTPDNRWPDAWCAQCDQAYRQHGEWNAKNVGVLDQKVVCQYCYQDGNGISVATLMDENWDAWWAIREPCWDELNEKQQYLADRYGLDKHERWDLDSNAGRMVVSIAGLPAVSANCWIVGSISNLEDTWMWSWANVQLPTVLTSELIKVRDFGEAHDIARLTVPLWPANESDGWEMTAVAVHVLGLPGAYLAPFDTGVAFILLRDFEEH